MIEGTGIEDLNSSFCELGAIKEYPLSLRIEETERRFLMLRPSPKDPKIKSSIGYLHIMPSQGYSKKRSNFEEAYSNLFQGYKNILKEEGCRFLFDAPFFAWLLFEISRGIIILFGYNPAIENAYLRVFPLPLTIETVQRFKSFAHRGLWSAAYLWTSKNDFDPEKNFQDLLRETAFNSAYEIEVIP